MKKIGWLPLILLLSTTSLANELRVAVASNFLGTLNQLAPLYETHSGQNLRISSGSTGQHYAQIVNGAPFDVFLAADTARPQRLVEAGLALEDSRLTYARGVLALWSNNPDLPLEGGAVLSAPELRHLAIANPRTAPYGAASVEVMRNLGVYEALKSGHLAWAENVTQTLQYVTSSTAQVGFIALAQIKEKDGSLRGHAWLPPTETYTPIEQQAVILNASPQPQAGRAFLDWLQQDQAQAVIKAAGYGS